jgi:uncharacterized damage-inducible protein DinB
MLQGWLDFHRETLFWKCDDLTDEQLRTASVAPSNLTLLGLVRHMAEVERGWFAPLVGTDKTWIYCTEDDLDGDFDNVADADVDDAFTTLRAEIDRYNADVAAYGLDDIRHGRRDVSLRWIYAHMIEEYARHNGHADLLRESLDGTTGFI